MQILYEDDGRKMPFLGISLIDSFMMLLSVVVFSLGYMKIKSKDEMQGSNYESVITLDDKNDEKLADSGYESIKDNRMSTPNAERMVNDG